MIRVGIVAGEHSGDFLGAQLVKSLLAMYPECIVEGIAGPKLIEAGCVQLFRMDDIAVMGFWEPIKRLPKILNIRRKLINYFLQNPPDIFIGIDAAELNISIEKALKAKGIMTVHYVSPSVWAWRTSRVHKVKKAVDMLLTLYPFEQEFYKKFNVPVTYVGHPLAASLPMVRENYAAARQQLKVAEGFTVIGIFPGSRVAELKAMTKKYLQAAQILQAKSSKLCFIMPLMESEHASLVMQIKAQVAPKLELKIIIANSKLVQQAADVAIATSGTVTLELMLNKVPMVIAYKTNFLTYWLMRMLIKVEYIGLPNLLARKALVPELIQQQATPTKIAQEVYSYVISPSKCAEFAVASTAMHRTLRCDTNAQIIKVIKGMLFK